MRVFPKDDSGRVTHIAIARVSRGLSVERLALWVDTDPETLRSWERGKIAPSSASLKRLHLALRWPIEAFLAEPVDPSQAENFVAKFHQDLESA